MKLIKKNQVIIYTIAVLIMVAGYLNYTTNIDNEVVQVSSNEVNETKDENIGDARLVSSEAIIEENEQNDNTTINETNINTTEETSATIDEYFSKSKLERDTMYSQMLETYENILNSSNALETQKQSATEEIEKINNTKNSIMICENILKTKGFTNTLIFVNDKSISVIIEATELKQEEIAQIQNIISREMKADIENIHISTK